METIALLDLEPKTGDFYEEVLHGLRQSQKTLPCKYFYDARGSHLFDQICELDEYYPTRTELAIMRDNIAEMAALLGPNVCLVEYGSGSSLKTRLLLDAARDLAAYVPVDISREHLRRTADELARAYFPLEVRPVCADYTQAFSLPVGSRADLVPVAYFPGSTIGNFHRPAARAFLGGVARLVGPGGGLLIGVDLKKDTPLLERAYNDRAGVTAAFNLNVLTRINRELGGNFHLDCFEHYAFYNEWAGRIEMHLTSLRDQQVHIGNAPICFDADETIHTECSYKYSLDDFAALASSASWSVERVWTDDRQMFSVQYLRAG